MTIKTRELRKIKNILVTGATGMVGVNLCDALNDLEDITLYVPTRKELNSQNQDEVNKYIQTANPDLIIHLAAKVGGIQANIDDPVGFLVENTVININIINGALKAKVPNLLNVGSSCMYPKDRGLLREEHILTGVLEPTNEGYAVSKILATLLCNYITKQYGLLYKTIIPCNLYGPFDNFDARSGHMLPAVIRKIHEAKMKQQSEVGIWGDGEARREFMYVGDLVSFILFALKKFDKLPQVVNVGLGYDYTVNEYYDAIAKVIGYSGKFVHDISKPVGMRKKLMDVSRVTQLGWQAKTSLLEGILSTYKYYLSKLGENDELF